MTKQQLIFIGVGLVVVVYLIKKLQPGETQVITQAVPIGSVPNTSGNDLHALYEQSRNNAFNALAGVATSQQAAEVQTKNIETSLQLENVRAQAANSAAYVDQATKLGLADYELKGLMGGFETQKVLGGYGLQAQLQQLLTEKDIAGIEADTQRMRDKYGYDATVAGYQSAYDLSSLLSKTELQKLEAQLAADKDYNTSYFANLIETMKLDQANQQSILNTQINTLNSAANNFRNQSLERQGTILNAYSNLFTGNAPYNYVSAFGGARPPGILQQLFPQGIGATVGQLLGGLLK